MRFILDGFVKGRLKVFLKVSFLHSKAFKGKGIPVFKKCGLFYMDLLKAV